MRFHGAQKEPPYPRYICTNPTTADAETDTATAFAALFIFGLLVGGVGIAVLFSFDSCFIYGRRNYGGNV